MSSIAIIIPCYNEAQRLQTGAFTSFAGAHEDVRLFFVNDGSTDNTAAALQTMEPLARIIDLPQNLGKGEAVRKGMLAALDEKNFDFVGYLDADLSTSLEDFYTLYINCRDQNLDLAIGSRIKKMDNDIRRSFTRHFVGRGIATMIDLRFNLGVYDTQCGAKVFRASVLRPLIIQPFNTRWFFDVELLNRIKQKGHTIKGKEIPLSQWHNVPDSKLGVLSFPRVVKELLTLFIKK